MPVGLLLLLIHFSVCGHYKSFKVAVYTRAYEVKRMSNLTWLAQTWKTITDQVKVDKVYLETHRDRQIVSDRVIEQVKTWFRERGVETAGGITYTINEANNFETFCYSNPSHRKEIQNLAEITASHHDSFILDDFFFTNCKSNVEITAKGNQSWSDYRRALLAEAGKTLVVEPAHAVNPHVKVIIKYPNWYDHFPGLGFDLAAGPKIFDGVWTGTETRSPASAQHLQNYLSYAAIRYFENCAPGRNGGGWVDVYGCDGRKLGADRYAEQLWLTMFAKAKEISLFAYDALVSTRFSSLLHRTLWQGQGPSFDYDSCVAPFYNEKNEKITPTTFARFAGCTLEQIDAFVGKLGNPLGIKSYNPPNSLGDDFLQNFLGMIGLPMEMVPDYPTDAKVVLLTAQAAADPDIAKKMSATIRAGGDVFVTSGLIAAAPKEVSKIVELQARKKILINNFDGNVSTKGILMRQIWYQTNDASEIVSAGRPLVNGYFGVPIVLRGQYGEKGGSLYALAIPDDFADLYHYPEVALNAFRQLSSKELGIYFLGPAKVSLFVYDNGYFIIENFNDIAVNINLVMNRKSILREEGKQNEPIQVLADVPKEMKLNPHQYRVFSSSAN